MATRKKRSARTTTSQSKVTVDRGDNGRTPKKSPGNFLDKIQNDLEKNQSYLNLILGALIVIVLGVLIFNYFSKPATDNGNVTPQAEQTTDQNGDVAKESLPGKYTVKEGDTLFLIAQNYYNDGGKYEEIVKANSLPSESIDVGQQLTIPKLETDSLAMASASPEVSAAPEMSASPEVSASPEAGTGAMSSPDATPLAMTEPSPSPIADYGTGGAVNQTTWGETISSDTYTVQPGDWLSKIAGRSYGDITKYNELAKANNIPNPDSIEVGMVLKIPRT